MPLLSIEAAEAFEIIHNNPYAWWVSEGKNSLKAQNCAASRLNREPFLNLSLSKDIAFKKEDAFYAVGSCFAREIEIALKQQHCLVSSVIVDEMIPDVSFLNRYNVPSMLLEFQRCLDPDFIFTEQLLGEATPGLFRDFHYGAAFQPRAWQDCLMRRDQLKAYFRRILASRVIILTLGVNEAWYDSQSGCYLNTWCDIETLKKTPHLELHVLSVSENVAALEQIYALLKRYMPQDFEMIVTVSPVPLYATFTKEDVIVANNRSKSILRAAAAEFCLRHQDLHYFPSYEIALNSNPQIAFENDRRHVSRGLAKHIVGNFSAHFFDKKPVALNSVLDFSEIGNADEFMVYGWSQPEKHGTWTSGEISLLRFKIPQSEAVDIHIEMEVMPFIVPKKHPTLEVQVLINGVEQDKWSFDENKQGWLKHKLFYSNPTLNQIEIMFRIVNPQSPKAIQVSEDTRQLGFALKTLALISKVN